MTEKIITAKVTRGLKWADVAAQVGLSKEWVTAACLGQMALSAEQAELIHEEFGDGIMSAIDFKMDLKREPDPKGDRVSIVMSGKFLPYKTY